MRANIFLVMGLAACASSSEPCEETGTCAGSGKSDGAGATTRLLAFSTRFEPTASERIGDVDLPKVAGLSVAGERRKFIGVHTYLRPAVHETVDGLLGSLSRSQFDAVKAELGGRSEVVYDASRSYALSDFLPPTLQALLHQDIEVEDERYIEGADDVPSTINDHYEKYIMHTANCHGTAWAALHAYQGKADEVDIFFGDPMLMESELTSTNSQNVEAVATYTRAQFANLQVTQALKPGDVVGVLEAESQTAGSLVHTATYVGGGLFFDKPDIEVDDESQRNETPYRMTTRAGVTANIDAADVDYRIKVERAKRTLAPGAEAFSSEIMPGMTEFARKLGKALGTTLVSNLRFGATGGLIAVDITALETFGVARDASGRGKLR